MKPETLAEIRKLFVTPGAQPAAGQIGVTPMMRVVQQMPNEREMDFQVQTTQMARDGMVIAARAFDPFMERFMRNPIFKAGHVDVGPAGEPTGIGVWTRMQTGDTGTVGRAAFGEGTRLADEYFQLYRQNIYRMVSVEWLTHDGKMQDINVDGKRVNAPVVTSAELLSVDAVAIGSDPGALRRAMHAYESANSNDVSDVAKRTCRRIEELLTPSIERLYAERHAVGGMLGGKVQRLVGEPLVDIDDKINTAVDAAAKRIFNDDPDGMLATLIRDVVQVSMRHGGQVDPDDDFSDDDHDNPRGAGDVVVNQLDQLARTFKAS